MIIESAFTILPESIAGLGFQRVSREANAVSAFYCSLLNALHAKNIVDPIQRLQQEKKYATKTVPLPIGGENRHCDIYIDYGGSLIGSQRLANFGWRYQNYLEAKFLKSYSKTETGQDTRTSTNSAEIVADLIRLVCLVPEPELVLKRSTAKSATARYFLVISDEPLDIFINKYLKDLASTFKNPSNSVSIELDLSSGKASKTFSERVGRGFRCLKLNLTHVTCFCHYPLVASLRPAFWMLLLRIDAAKIELLDPAGNKTVELSIDRTLKEGDAGDYIAIRDFVAKNLKWDTSTNLDSWLIDIDLCYHRLFRSRVVIYLRIHAAFQEILKSSGIDIIRLAPYTPQLNTYTERFVQSIKTESLDHLLLIGEASLWRAVANFVEHYHQDRPHQGLGNNLIELPQTVPPSDKYERIQTRECLGWLLKSYHHVSGQNSSDYMPKAA